MPKPYIPNDKLAQKAKKEGYRARSVYKLQELDEKFKLVSLNQDVLDLGAAPGSWMQYISDKIGDNGSIIGIDLQIIQPISKKTKSYIADISNLEAVKNIFRDKKFDLIVSDLASNTTGIKEVDASRSVELNRAVFEIAKLSLKKGCKLVMKVFQGEEMNIFLKDLKNYFKKVSVFKSVASRDRSREVYIVCW